MALFKAFLPKEDPKELVRKWQSQLRTEARSLDRQVRDIQFEEKKAQKAVKEAAKRNDMQSAKAIAKEIVQTRKTVGRLYVHKAHLLALGTQLSEQLAMVRVAGALSKSTEVMKEVNAVIKAPELQRTMMEMSREMMRAGLIDEMISDAMDSAMETDGEEEEVEEEIEKVLAEVAGQIKDAPVPQKAAAPRGAAHAAAAQEEEEDDAEDAALQARFNAVKMMS